tara:strand:+ start:2228 stop:2563 length:336 start_codon:yes stop_codon:yes gene_type:complete
MAFKMKGSPMQRNFGIGSPAKMTGDPKKEMTQEEKDAAIASAMPDAEVSTISKDTMAEAKALGLMVKGESGGSQFDKAKARDMIRDIGDWRTDEESVAKKQNIRRLVKAFS